MFTDFGQQVVRPGMTLNWGSGSTCEAVAAAEPDTVRIIYEIREHSAEGSADRMLLATDPSALHHENDARERRFFVCIALNATLWGELFANEAKPHGSARLVSSAEMVAEPVVFPLSPGARLAVESIRRCPFAGAFREMALTARCHDLLLEFFSAMRVAASTRPASVLRGVEEQVRSAAELLNSQLESPPTIALLARRVGLSETTLRRVFHQVYNTTVYGFVRERRMEKAKNALQSGTVTVLEAAALVGYSNPSNFAAAFRRQFGVNPKQFQLAVRR